MQIISGLVLQNFLVREELEKITEEFHINGKMNQKSVVNLQDEQGYTPMHLASFYGDFHFLQYMTKLGGDPSITATSEKKQVLDLASNNKVRLSLVDLKDAARKGDISSFTLLINTGNQINERKTIFLRSPIHTVFKTSFAFDRDK